MSKYYWYFLFLCLPLYGEEGSFLKRKVQLKAEKVKTIYPAVSGRVVYLAENLACQKINPGATLYRLESLSYEVALNEAETDLKKALYELKQEEGRKIIAEKEWELIDQKYKSMGLGENLALRKLQIDEKKANVELAESRLRKAQRDLDWTVVKIENPDMVVLKYFVEVGQTVSKDEKIAELAETNALKLDIKIPVSFAKKIFRQESSSISLMLSQPFDDSPFKEPITLNLKKSDFTPVFYDPDGKTITFSIHFKNPYEVCQKEEFGYLYLFPFEANINLQAI